MTPDCDLSNWEIKGGGTEVDDHLCLNRVVGQPGLHKILSL